jgi:hypothetical protein
VRVGDIPFTGVPLTGDAARNGGFRFRLEPYQQLVVAEVAHCGSAFFCAPAQAGVILVRPAYVQVEQRGIYLTRRVDLKGDLVARAETGERGAEEPAGRLGQRRGARPASRIRTSTPPPSAP